MELGARKSNVEWCLLAVTLNTMASSKIGKAVFYFAEVRVATSVIRGIIDANNRGKRDMAITGDPQAV